MERIQKQKIQAGQDLIYSIFISEENAQLADIPKLAPAPGLNHSF